MFVKFERKIWLFVFGICIFSLALSHFFFQNYLGMRPCEFCVYIRFDMLMIAFGALFGFFSFFKFRLKILAFGFCFYGVIFGFLHAIKLHKIHTATLSGDAFSGLSGCKTFPKFPLNLALHEYFPSLFLPTGLCGLDASTPDINANGVQEFFIKLYSQGWYLIPSHQVITMAECVLGIFIVFLGIFIFNFFHFFKQNKVDAIFALILILFLFFIGKF